MIQIRERELSARDLCRLVRLALVTATKPRVLVNDRADIAIACGAHGVHLRSRVDAPAQIRQIKGWKIKEMIVSVSCHNAEDAERAEREGAIIVCLRLCSALYPRSIRENRSGFLNFERLQKPALFP